MRIHMKLIRKRRPSMKTALGITKAKRRIAKATGIPTTKSGRKRKALNTITGGGYGKYVKTRAAVNRPFKASKRMGCGCLISLIEGSVVLLILLAVLFM